MTLASTPTSAPYDALLLLSFGGPEGPDDVLPFLQNVTRGRGIPDERLVEVGAHYELFGGRSPINDQNRALRQALEDELRRRGLDLPVLWGNRNWDPYLADVLREAHDRGHRRVLSLTTSAYSSYSGCRQYREDLGEALVTLAGEGRHLEVDQVRRYFNAPGFVQANVDAVAAGVRRLRGSGHAEPRLVFVTHSIPESMTRGSGPRGDAYVTQHRDVAATVAAGVAQALGTEPLPWDLVFCSRSGPPSQPWTEPDVNDHLEQLSQRGVQSVVLAPIGFVSDHMEVVYDLDTEAAATAERLGLAFERVPTAGTAASFVTQLVDLVLERADVARRGTARVGGEAFPDGGPDRATVGSLEAGHEICAVGCCPGRQAGRPAACGADWSPPVLTVTS